MASKSQGFDINQWIEQLKRCEYIKESEVKKHFENFRNISISLPFRTVSYQPPVKAHCDVQKMRARDVHNAVQTPFRTIIY